MTEWLAKRILFPFRVASTTKSVEVEHRCRERKLSARGRVDVYKKARRNRAENIAGIRRTVVQVEQEAGHVLVVDSASSVRFILGNKLDVRKKKKKNMTGTRN